MITLDELFTPYEMPSPAAIQHATNRLTREMAGGLMFVGTISSSDALRQGKVGNIAVIDGKMHVRVENGQWMEIVYEK